MKALLLAALLFLPGCAVLPDEADLENAIPPAEAFECGIVVPAFVAP